MWPWGHAAVGYLLLSLWWRLDYDAPPIGAAVLALGFGTQLPDLIDKPLAWTWTILPNGRSLAHSALTATLLCVVLWVVVRESGRRRVAGAFALGYWAHILSDGVGAVLEWQLGGLAYLGYPVLAPVTYDTGKSFIAHFQALEVTPLLGLELVLVALALLVWSRDGYPGLRTLGEWVGVVDRAAA
jgi:hypothetical protein